MKIHGVKLNKKNFWIPFLTSSILSFLILFLSLALWFDAFSQGVLQYLLWMVTGGFISLSILSVIASLPSFFTIKRLLSKNPKKLFYFEFPVLVIIYSTVGSMMIIFALILGGGPTGMTLSDILILIIPQIIFLIIWIFLLTVSLYFYYRRNNFFQKSK